FRSVGSAPYWLHRDLDGAWSAAESQHEERADGSIDNRKRSHRARRSRDERGPSDRLRSLLSEALNSFHEVTGIIAELMVESIIGRRGRRSQRLLIELGDFHARFLQRFKLLASLLGQIVELPVGGFLDRRLDGVALLLREVLVEGFGDDDIGRVV